MTRLLHLVHHPVPVAGRLDGDLAAGWQGVQEVDILLPVMLDPDRGCGLALTVNSDEDGEVLVGIASDNGWHGWSPIGAQVALS